MSNEISNNLLVEMDEVLKFEIAQRHSYFQLKYFLIGKEPTIQAKMWQCLREMKSRRDSITAIELEIEETKDKIELLDISIEKESLYEISGKNPKESVLLQREMDINLRQLERKKKAGEKSLSELFERKKWIEEESRFFLETFKNLYKIEPLKHFDDVDAQKEYWSEKLSQKLNLKMLTHNQLDTELIETIIALPDEIPLKKQALGTLQLRHASMVKQLQSAVGAIEDGVDKNKEK